jgi:diphthine synthase
MTIKQCIEQLLEVEEKRKEGGTVPDHTTATTNAYQRSPSGIAYGPETVCVGLARVGRDDERIVSGTMTELLDVDFGGPLHSFVIPGTLHPVETEYIDFFRVKKD